ncbi:MAG: DUF2197 domain-containing protein [Candidatus Heimdallarchaeota archaeon]|nr:DUF2197 domain-containing protein [Candidatus Heimdallarchaeota archaeon]
MVKCTLCNEQIKNYTPEFNQLEINESYSVYICQSCVEKFVKWQQRKFAKLFPTKRAKKLLKV